MINLLIQGVLLFILLMLYLSATDGGDSSNWGKALFLAIALTVMGVLPNQLGVAGWIIAIVVSFALIIKMLGQSVAGALLILIILGTIQYIIEMGIRL